MWLLGKSFLRIFLIMAKEQIAKIQSLEEAISHPSVIDITKDYIELGLDAFIRNGAIEEIPLVKTVVGIYGFVGKVDETLFAKKISQLLYAVSDVPDPQRLKVIKEINDSKKYASDVGSKLIEILHRVDSDKKPLLIGNLFRAVLVSQLSYDDFLRLCHVINITYFDDLHWITENNDGTHVIDDVPDSIGISGLVTSSFVDAFEGVLEPEDTWTSHTYLTGLGKAIVDFGFTK